MPRSRSETPVSRRSRSPLSDRESSPERPTEYRVHIAELEPGIDETKIRKIFQRFGTITDVWVASASCFGFVVYKYKDDAQKAIDQMDGRLLGNERIRVTWARPRTRNRSHRHDPNMRCYKCGERGHFSRECNGTSQTPIERTLRRRDTDYSRFGPAPVPVPHYGRSRSPFSPAALRSATAYFRHEMQMYSAMGGRRYDPYMDGYYFPMERSNDYEHRGRPRAVRLTPPSASLRYARR